VQVKSENYLKEYSPSSSDIKDISKFTEDSMKRSKGPEDTKNIGYTFKYRRAEYLACSDDYDMIQEGKQIIT